MRSRRFRNSRTALGNLIDQAVENRETAGSKVSTPLIVGDVVSAAPAVVMLSEFGRLLGPRVNARLKARGLLVVDEQTWERHTDVNVTDSEFKVTTRIKYENLERCRRRYRADRDVEKFLNRQAARLGRSVTIGEFEAQVDAIYTRHGF